MRGNKFVKNTKKKARKIAKVERAREAKANPLPPLPVSLPAEAPCHLCGKVVDRADFLCHGCGHVICDCDVRAIDIPWGPHDVSEHSNEEE